MKKIYIILRNIFLLSFVAFIYYIARPEIKPKEILSFVRSLFETKEETRNRRIDGMHARQTPEQGRALCAGDEGILAAAGKFALGCR